MARVECLSKVTEIFHDSYNDHRGQLYTIWKNSETKGLEFNHDKVATSDFNVLRGLHTDKSWKLITCLYGKIQLVVVNYDSKSSEFLNSKDLQSLLSSSTFHSELLAFTGSMTGRDSKRFSLSGL